MEEKSYLCLQPTYMNDFQCDGNLCQSKCCKNWGIIIDGNTYQRYCGIKSKDERKKITSEIKWVRNGNTKQFVVRLRQDGSCPFLREDYFCEIQKNHGERFLSEICATYPRRISHLDDVMERGLTLSCPVAAKLILLQKEPLEFEQTEIVEKRPMSKHIWNLKKIPLGEHLIDLQYSCISLLQNRKLTLDQRLILMGFFLEQAEELVANGREAEVKALAEGYASDQMAEQAIELVKSILMDTNEYLRCMFGMVEALYGKGHDARNSKENECLNILTELYQFSEDQETASISKMREIYDGYKEFAKETVRDYSYIFENCMVNEFFVNVHLFWVTGSVKEDYLYFLMSYKMMEFLTVVQTMAWKDNPKEDVLVEGLSLLAGRIDHTFAYRKHILEEIRRYKKDMTYFMRALLDGR